MNFRLWFLIAGVMGYAGCLVQFQDLAAKAIASVFCAFIIGIGIVLVADKFDDLESEVKELREQIARIEKEEE